MVANRLSQPCPVRALEIAVTTLAAIARESAQELPRERAGEGERVGPLRDDRRSGEDERDRKNEADPLNGRLAASLRREAASSASARTRTSHP